MDFQVKDMEIWTQPLGTGQELLETSLRVKCHPGWGAGEARKDCGSVAVWGQLQERD